MTRTLLFLTQFTRLMSAVAVLSVLCTSSYASVVVSDDMESYPLGAFGTVSDFSDASYGGANSAAAIVAGQALEFAFDVKSGVGALNTNVEAPFPAVAMNNTSTNLTNYTLEFDVSIPSGINTGWFGVVEVATPGSGPRTLNLNMAGLTVGGGAVHHSMSLAAMGQPFGTVIDPTQANWVYRLVALGFPADGGGVRTTVLLDNVQVNINDEYVLQIDRDTGAGTLVISGAAQNIVAYSIGSAEGALIPGNWLSIADTGDADSGGSIDPDDVWQEDPLVDRDLLAELEPIDGGGDNGAVWDSPISLGNIWTRSPFENLQFSVTALDELFNEVQLPVAVEFTGNGGEPFSRSDFDLDGDIDGDDYSILQTNHLQTLGGTLPIDTFALGDINGDLVNDYLDFRSFKADYIAANGAGAFASLLAAEGAVPEPGAAGLLMLAVAVVALAARRKRVAEDAQDCFAKTHDFSERHGTMNCISKVFFLFAFLLMIPSVSHAQTDVISESFDTRSDLTGINVAAGTNPTLTLVDQGGGDNALQWIETSAAGGFFGSGFTIADLEVEPGPGGPNISSNLADYQLSFDLTINAINGFTPNLEIWLADGPRFSTNNANLYTASGLVNGVNNISFTLENPTTTTPNGFTSPGGAWSPTADDWWLQVNTISFNAPAGATVDYTIDNIQVTIDIATSLALVVDPANGKAQIRNISAADITFDYYRIESTNGSLLTADYNGSTGWDSLDDQGIDAIGAGVGESWDEVAAANSASQLVEQFLLGDTTLGPGQSVSLGAPVNPAILANQINTLALKFGGPSYATEAIAQVLFEDLSGLTGDYNEDGVVDAADYVVWRKDPASFGGQQGYDDWRANFGATSGSGAAVDAGRVPEPSTGCLAALVIATLLGRRRRRIPAPCRASVRRRCVTA